MSADNEILSNIYFNPSHVASLRGEESLIRSVKKGGKKWLQAQDTFTLPMLIYNVNNIDDVWKIDLIDMQSFKSHDNNISFLFVCIDVLSKIVWLEPLYNKSNVSIKKAFEELFEKTKRRPVMIQSDSGKDFVRKICLFIYFIRYKISGPKLNWLTAH